MSILAVEKKVPNVENVRVTEDTLSVNLSDGRTISVPLEWFPRLVQADPEERNNWRLIGRGHGIHWEDLDEDISVDGLLAGKPSGESQASFKKWLNQRQARLTTRASHDINRLRRKEADILALYNPFHQIKGYSPHFAERECRAQKNEFIHF